MPHQTQTVGCKRYDGENDDNCDRCSVGVCSKGCGCGGDCGGGGGDCGCGGDDGAGRGLWCSDVAIGNGNDRPTLPAGAAESSSCCHSLSTLPARFSLRGLVIFALDTVGVQRFLMVSC